MAEIGRLGAWTFALDQQPMARAQELAAEFEELGYGAVWIPEAVGRDPFVSAALLLSGTEQLIVATGIATIYARDAMAMNGCWQALSEAFPGRFLLGLGVSHQPMVEGMRGAVYGPPLTAMHEYLEAMDSALYFAAKPIVAPERVLAALGPKMLALSRDMAGGAHPYNVPPEHTAIAREILGPDRLLAPDQKVILETDPAAARETARDTLAIYSSLPNYTNNLRRLGFTEEDLTPPLSNKLVDALVVWGDVEAIRTRIDAHHAAGADHVAIQVLPGNDVDRLMRDYRTLSEALL